MPEILPFSTLNEASQFKLIRNLKNCFPFFNQIETHPDVLDRILDNRFIEAQREMPTIRDMAPSTELVFSYYHLTAFQPLNLIDERRIVYGEFLEVLTKDYKPFGIAIRFIEVEGALYDPNLMDAAATIVSWMFFTHKEPAREKWNLNYILAHQRAAPMVEWRAIPLVGGEMLAWAKPKPRVICSTAAIGVTNMPIIVELSSPHGSKMAD